MSSFPVLPRIRGESDDDASIHLYSNVGPAVPPRHQDFDRQIMKILKQSPNILKARKSTGSSALNEDFESFICSSNYQAGYQSLDTDEEPLEDEETDVEDGGAHPKGEYQPHKKLQSQTNALEKPNDSSSQLWRTFGFLLGLLFCLSMLLWVYPSAKTLSPPVDRGLKQLQVQVLNLADSSAKLYGQVDTGLSKLSEIIEDLLLKYESLHTSLSTLNGTFREKEDAYLQFQKSIIQLENRLNNMQLVNGEPENLESKLNEVDDRILKLKEISTILEASTYRNISDFLENLSEYVPVFMRDGRVQYLPEFLEYISSVVSKQTQNLDVSQAQQQRIAEVVRDNLTRMQHHFILKKDFEDIFSQRFETEEKRLTAKFNKLIDKVDLGSLVNGVNFTNATNKIALDNLLEVISKSVSKLNYADYNLGSRILGFLTRNDSHKKKSLPRKLFLGWFDYLRSNGLKSPKYLKYNANNVLIDGGRYWQCEGNECTLGVRLASPIVLTDLVLKFPKESRPVDIMPPKTVSVFVKPLDKESSFKLKNYQLNLRPDFVDSTRGKRYTSGFFKIQETILEWDKSIEHIRIPATVLNLEVTTKDLYFEFENDQFPVGLYNLKAYGVPEPYLGNCLEDIPSLVNLLDLDSDSSSMQQGSSNLENNAPVLGEDMYKDF